MVRERIDGGYVVKDANGQPWPKSMRVRHGLTPTSRMLLTMHEARRIVGSIMGMLDR